MILKRKLILEKVSTLKTNFLKGTGEVKHLNKDGFFFKKKLYHLLNKDVNNNIYDQRILKENHFQYKHLWKKLKLKKATKNIL